jgi:hypothetical protein
VQAYNTLQHAPRIEANTSPYRYRPRCCCDRRLNAGHRAESRAQEAAATERGGNAKSESMDREAGLIEVRAEEYAYGIMCGEWSSE